MTALLSAIIGVVAALLGAWFSSRQQRRQWRDDVRISSYVDLLDNARDFLFRGAEMGASQGGEDVTDAHTRLRAAMQKYRTSYNKVRLVSPASVAAVNERLHHYLTHELYAWFEQQNAPHREDAAEVVKARDLIEEFLDEAERTLGLSKPDARMEKEIRSMRKIRSR